MKRLGAGLIAAILLISTFLPMLFGTVSYAAGQTASGTLFDADTSENEVVSAVVREEKGGKVIVFTVRLSEQTLSSLSGKKLQIFAFAPWQSLSDLQNMSVLTVFMPSGRESTVTVPYESSLLYAGFMVVHRYDDGSYYRITPTHYLDNPDFFSVITEEQPLISEKGLTSQNLTRLCDLGASSTVITVPVNEYLTSVSGESTEYLAGDTHPWLIRTSQIRMLDEKIDSMTRAGIRVYLQFVLTAPTVTMGEEIECLYRDSQQTDSTSGGEALQYAFASQTKEGAECLQAFFEYMANRYSSTENGICTHWILGDRVNESNLCYYSNYESVSQLAESYVSLLRLADTALRSRAAKGVVYVPISNRYLIADALSGQFGSSDFLTAFLTQIRLGGDFSWRIAADLSPSPECRGDIRSDPQVTQDDSTPYLTMANLTVLTDRLSEFRDAQGNTEKSVLVYRFSAAGQIGDEESERNQAAAYTYAYAGAVAYDEIEALIYSEETDTDSVTGIGGLFAPTQDGLPQGKLLAEVFRVIDTDGFSVYADQMMQQLDIRRWGELFPELAASKLKAGTLHEVDGTVSDSTSDTAVGEMLFDFSSSLAGFELTNNAVSADVREDNGDRYTAVTLYSDGKGGWMGIGKTFADGFSLKAYRSLQLTLKASAEGYAYVQVKLQLAGRASSATVFDGSCIIPTDTWQTVSFDLTSFTADAETVGDIRILIRPVIEVQGESLKNGCSRIAASHTGYAYEAAPASASDGGCTLYLSAVSGTKSSVTAVWRIVLIAVSVLCFLCAAFYLLVWNGNCRRERRRKVRQRRKPNGIGKN